jgi:hypothetical protein
MGAAIDVDDSMHSALLGCLMLDRTGGVVSTPFMDSLSPGYGCIALWVFSWAVHKFAL